MPAERSAVICFGLYEFTGNPESPPPFGRHPHPRELYKEFAPHAVRTAWVPQTVADMIWVFYEFATTEERDAFIANLPPYPVSWETPAQSFYDHWTRTPFIQDRNVDPFKWHKNARKP